MSLEAGQKLAHYEVIESIGKGGMGEVYRARDKKLGRDVAVKVLPEHFAQDKERMARFEREARVLVSLNHPNIAAVYGLEEDDGAVDQARRFSNNTPYLRHLVRTDPSSDRWKAFDTGRPPGAFMYRESPRPLVPLRSRHVTMNDPPLSVPGTQIASHRGHG